MFVKRENDLSGSSPHASSIVHIEDDKTEEDRCDDGDDGTHSDDTPDSCSVRRSAASLRWDETTQLVLPKPNLK